MNKILTKACSAILSSALIFSVGSAASTKPVSAESTYSEPMERSAEGKNARSYLALKSIKNQSIYAYSKATLTYNGKALSVDARIINGEIYIPTRTFINAISSIKVTYNSSLKTLYAVGLGLDFSVSDGAYAIFANGRALFSMSPSVIMSNGRMYSPLSLVSEALGLELLKGTAAARLSGSVRPLESADKYYRSDEVLWLARIISAESRGESLLGQIAVGSVVMNRVKSKYYPNTIYGVIFDRKYGIQFSPIENGSIYNTPTSSAMLAAKICLDGFRVSDSVLFFLEPTLSTSSWIPKSREYLFTIGHHDFYA